MKLTEINEKYPEHSRTSCSDEVLYNRGWNEGGNLYCPRCQALYELKIQAAAGRAGYQACVDAVHSAAINAYENGDSSLLAHINDLQSLSTVLGADQYAERVKAGDV